MPRIPEAILGPEGHVATGIIQIGINYTITWGHGSIHAQAWAAVGLWPYRARVYANIYSSWYQ